MAEPTKQQPALMMKPDHKGHPHHHPDKENIPPSAHDQLSCCPAGAAPFFLGGGSGKQALCEPAAAAKRRPLQDITALMAQAASAQQSRQQAPTGASLQKSLWGAGAGAAGDKLGGPPTAGAAASSSRPRMASMR